MSLKDRIASLAGSKTRVQNTTSETTITSSRSALHRIVMTNANAAVQSLQVEDGLTILGVYECPPDTSITLHFGIEMAGGIVVTPSDAGIDALVIYDQIEPALTDLSMDIENAVTIGETVTVTLV